MHLSRCLFVSALLALPGMLQAQVIVAHGAPTGVSANQFITNPLGLDFKVNLPMVILSLGVFELGTERPDLRPRDPSV